MLSQVKIDRMKASFRSVGVVIVAMVFVAGFLAACGSQAGLEARDATIKALWYSGSGHDTRQGIAEVDVAVGINPSGNEFDLDLETEKAQGAGPEWSAATWSAASVSTLFSFRDPRTISMSISIDGSIDGPSAGGLLSSVMLALLSDEPLLPNVSMTGTINPDGSVGSVSGIPAKIRAAKDAGIKKVLIPAGMEMAIDPATSQTINVVQQGKKLGVEVVEVATVFDALDEMTDGTDDEPDTDTKPVVIQPQVIESLRSSSKELEAMVNRKLTDLRSLAVPNSEIAGIRQDLAAGSKLLKRGAVVGAYSRLSQANYAAGAALEVRRTRQRIDKEGLAPVEQSFKDRLDELQTENHQRGQDVADQQAQNRQQMVGLPDALAWSTDTAVEYAVYRRHLELDNPDAQELQYMAAGVSTFTIDSEVSLRQSAAALMASGNTPGNEQAISDSLTSYSRFLEQTGNASLHYYEQVVAKLTDDKAKETHRLAEYDYFAADLLRTRLQEFTDRDASIGRQRTVLSMAMSYYVATATLVIKAEALQARAIDPFNTELVIADSQGFDRAVASSVGVNQELLEYLDEEGIDSSYAHWGVDWGRYLASLPESLSNNSDRLLGLTYMWYASLQLLLMNSQTVVSASTGD